MQYEAINAKLNAVPVALLDENGKPTNDRWYMLTGVPAETFEALYIAQADPVRAAKPAPKPKPVRKPGAKAGKKPGAKAGKKTIHRVESVPASPQTSWGKADGEPKPATQRDAVRQALKRGPMSLEHLAGAIDSLYDMEIPPGTLSTICCQLRDKGELLKDDEGIWRLAQAA